MPWIARDFRDLVQEVNAVDSGDALALADEQGLLDKFVPSFVVAPKVPIAAKDDKRATMLLKRVAQLKDLHADLAGFLAVLLALTVEYGDDQGMVVVRPCFRRDAEEDLDHIGELATAYRHVDVDSARVSLPQEL